MDPDFAKLAYEEHRQLFLHYSSLVFRSRVGIATLIVGTFVYLAGFPPADKPGSLLFGLPSVAVLSYLAALLIPVLFAMETAYLTRLVEVAEAAGRIEKHFDSSLYFAAYARREPWWHYLLYALGTSALLFSFSIHSGQVSGWWNVLVPVPLVVLFLVAWRVPRHR